MHDRFCGTGTTQDAEDAVQQAALRGLERIGTYDPTRPFKAWWFAILRHCCVDILRAAKAEAVKTASLGPYDACVDSLSEGVDWEHLSNALDRLSADHREILRLRYFAEMTYQELSETLAIPQGTVMSRLHLARQALARRTREEER